MQYRKPHEAQQLLLLNQGVPWPVALCGTSSITFFGQISFASGQARPPGPPTEEISLKNAIQEAYTPMCGSFQ